ncbi:MAG: GNAT family N-acetyltransferase [Candidatus Marinimicrobia bacterium]|nr:GNAT family N-acetyltransferase [Candidatus Neomarinimicrobiota bacterium]
MLKDLEWMVFQSSWLTLEKFQKMADTQTIFLVAYHAGKAVGFKLGYIKKGENALFSWLGGVHPDYRRQGIAQGLLEEQEKAARELNLDSVYFTSYDRFPAMIALGEKNGYQRIRSEMDGGELKYWYEKRLNEQ